MRLIDENIVDDERLATLSRDAALFYLLLRLKIDDYGRFHAKPELLNSKLFPLRRDIRHTDITRWTDECRQAGMLRCYVDTRGRAILEVFDARQCKKFMKSDFDPPDEQQNFSLPDSKKRREERGIADGRSDHGGKAPPISKNKTDNKKHPAVEQILRMPEGPKIPEMWKLLKDEKQLTERIQQEVAKTAPDRELVNTLKLKRAGIRAQMAQAT